MKTISLASGTVALFVAGLLFFASTARAEEIRVMTSGAFTAAYLQLIPEFERTTQDKIVTAYGASMGNAPDSIPSRLERGEPVDVVILAAGALEELTQQGKVVPGSRVDLVRSSIGMAVRAGAPKPDIGTVDALKRALLKAKIDRVFGLRQRRLSFARAVSAPRDRGPGQGEVQENRQRAGRCRGCARRCRNRLPADQRAASRARHRLRRTFAARGSKGHRIFGWRRGRVETCGRGPSAHQIPGVTGRGSSHQENWPGAAYAGALNGPPCSVTA